MRIVGGRLRGRSLVAPETRAIRPTTDRRREALFNILDHVYGHPCEGARVIDLFAGTGALGLEAVSRGAAFALFVDEGAEARACLRASIEALGLGGVTRIFRRDATRLGAAPAGAPFDLAFLDPPYGLGLAGPALAALAEGQWLEDGALCVIEEAERAEVDLPPGFGEADRRTQGGTAMTLCRYRGARPALSSPG